MNICIIGFGEIGKKFFKILNLKNNKIYIVEIKKINLKFRNVLIFQDVSNLPKEIFYDLIIICTSQITKIEIFKKISNLKVKKIITEKPVAYSTIEFSKILHLLKNTGFNVYTNYVRQYLKEFLEIKKIISTKKLGTPKLATFYYSKGVFYNCVHFIDFAISVFGFPNKISIISKNKSLSKKNDYLIDFYFQYQNYKVYFLSFETRKVSSSSFEIILGNGKIDVTSDRYLKIYNIKKNTLVKNINQFSLIKTKKINYEKSFRNLINLVNKSKYNKEGFITNDKKIYKVLKKLI